MTHTELKQKAKTLPKLPGVYLMKDEAGYVIYVGKSKALKDRVSSYFRSLKHAPPKVSRLVAAISDFSYIVTDTELDALLLECQLIKYYKPLYNRLLKDDKKYRYIYIGGKTGLETIVATYDKEEQGSYYGPYDRQADLLMAVEGLRAYYKLPSCKDVVCLENCLPYKLKRCLAPCHPKNRSNHQLALKGLHDFLQGETKEAITYYEELMRQAAEGLEFELATKYRQMSFALKGLCYRQEATLISLSQIRGIALLPLPTGGLKLYLLIGNRVVYGICLKNEDENNTHHLRKKLLPIYNQYLNKEIIPLTALEKNEIDEHLIMYTYLNTHPELMYMRQDNQETHEAFIERFILKYETL